MARMVQCAKLGRELPGLDKAPFKSELGQRVFENVSKQAWGLWMEQSIVLINHYGLNMADPRAHEFIMEQMEEFFFGGQKRTPNHPSSSASTWPGATAIPAAWP